MSGSNLLVDSNILIYLLNGDHTIESILEESTVFLSFINKIELLSFQNTTSRQQEIIEEIIHNTTVIQSNDYIIEVAIQLRKKYKLKTPDAIVLATSVFLEMPLLTADARLFKIKEIEIIQYKV
jgi:predicted nucleic acid-binding protein